MVEIHNIDIKIPIYFKDECIGICTSLISFTNVRAQIKELKSSDYSFEFKGEKFKLCFNGEIPIMEDDWYEYLYTDELIKLI